MRKIIDAHMHLFSNDTPDAEALANRVGHTNSIDHLRDVYKQLHIVHAVVMGNRSLALAYHDYPADLFHYCIGLDSSMQQEFAGTGDLYAQIEAHLQRESCCGIKLYPGYNKLPLSDPFYRPLYPLAARYGKPVAVHMGLTAHARAHLKYAHPLALDEVAADFPETSFVMCHFGNPFLDAACAVIEKNPNVAADLSGLLEGPLDLPRYREEQAGYLFLLKSWLAACNAWDRILYGTDWPIVNLAEYIRFAEELIPPQHRDKVFFENANRIYGLGL